MGFLFVCLIIEVIILSFKLFKASIYAEFNDLNILFLIYYKESEKIITEIIKYKLILVIQHQN